MKVKRAENGTKLYVLEEGLAKTRLKVKYGRMWYEAAFPYRNTYDLNTCIKDRFIEL